MKWTEMLREIKENREFLDGRSDLAGIGGESQIIKSYLAQKQEVSENNTLIATISTKAKDAYGDIVESKGGDFKRWRKNPVVMWAHDYKIPPIARGLWLKADDSTIVSKCEFAPTEFAQELLILGQPGANGKPWIKGWSIGFLPKETEWIKEAKEEGEDERITGIRFLIWELLEYSFCPIPANPQALTDAIVKGVLKVQNKDLLEQLQNSVTVVDLGAGLALNTRAKSTRAEDPDSTSGKKEDVGLESISTTAPPGEQKTQTFKYCVCSKCGYFEDKKAGDPCQKHKCPDCGAKLMGSNDKPKKDVDITLDVWKGNDPDSEVLEVKEISDAEVLKPYPNEHACRLRDPGDFKPGSFKRVKRKHDGKTYAVIMGRLKGETTMTEQAYRYPKDEWTEKEAKKHCKDHDGILFEPATGEGLEHLRKVAEKIQQEEVRELLASLRTQIEGIENSIKLMEKENAQDTEEYKKAQAELDKAKKELAMLLDSIEKGQSIHVTDAGVPEKKEKPTGQEKDKLTAVVKIDGMEIVEEFKERLEKAGAVLNKANKDKLKKASDLILEVLATAEKENDDKGASGKVKCQNCGVLIDYGKEPEVAMGAIKCPECKAVINQEGQVVEKKETDVLNGIEAEHEQAPVETKPEAIMEGVSLEDVRELLDVQGKTLHGIVRQTVRKMLGKVD